MKQTKNTWLQRLIAGILITALCFSTGLGATQASGSKKIRISKKKVSIEAGKTVRLKVTGTKKKVTWNSKNKSIATVSAKGLVKAKKAGKTKIIARISGNSYTCKVTVTPKKEPLPHPSEIPDSAVTSSPSTAQTPVPTITIQPTILPTVTPTLRPTPTPTPEPAETSEPSQKVYTFRSEKLLEEHYQKHGIEMGFSTMEDYVAAANIVIHSPDALHKLEKEDGDDVYYLEATNEFVIVSTDGYIRTYFYPDGGKEYFDRQ